MAESEAPRGLTKNELALVRNHQAMRTGQGAKYVIMQGGGGSGKTWSVCRFTASWAQQQPGLRGAMFRQDGARHTDGVIADFARILPDMGFTDAEVRMVKAPQPGLHFANGSYIGFRGTQDENRAHGPRWDWVYFNEVVEIPYDTFANIVQRCRGPVFIDFNPKVQFHWIWDRFVKYVGERPEILHVISTQLDNPYLPTGERATILGYEPTEDNIRRGTADKWRWEVYGLGRRGKREGLVFENVQTCDKFPDRYACELWGYGCDFGFVHPTALIECALWRGRLYLREVVYETGLNISDNPDAGNSPSLVGRMREAKIAEDGRIECDSAEPRSIKQMRDAGFDAVPSSKGPDSILGGIDLMKQFPIYVHEGSINLQREFENYTWKTAPRGRLEGKYLEMPVDEFNHGIDAARLWCLRNIPRRRPTYGDEQQGGRDTAFSVPLARW